MLHCIMMCTNTVVSSILCRFIHSFGQECPFTNLSNPPQVSFAASGSAKNNNNPMQWPGKLNIMLPNYPTFNKLEVLRVYTNKSNLGNLMFLLSIDNLRATFLVSYPHSYHPILDDLYCMQKQRRKTWHHLIKSPGLKFLHVVVLKNWVEGR